MKYTFITLFILFGIFFSSCKENHNEIHNNDNSDTVIVIGGLFSITGNWNTLGKDAIAAADIAINQANAIAAERGLSIRFSFTNFDTKLLPNLALESLKEANSKKIQILIGPQSSAELTALKSYADSARILLISPSSTAGSLAIPNDYILRICPNDTKEGPAIASMMKYEAKSVMIPFWRNDIGNKGLSVSASAAFAKNGGIVLSDISYEPGITDYSKVLSTLKETCINAIKQYGINAVAIYNPGFDEVVDIASYITSNDTVLSSIRWYGGDGTVGSQVLLSQPNFFEKVGYPCPAFGIGEAFTKADPIILAIQNRTGNTPDAYALGVYDAIMITALSIMGSDSKDMSKEFLRQSIVKQAELYYGATGWTILDENGDRKYASFDMLGLRSQAGKPLWQTVGTYSETIGYRPK